MAQEHANHGAVVLGDGRVLLAGGSAGSGNASEGPKPYLAELYDPNSDTWATTGSPIRERDIGFRLVAVPGGALLMGGTVPLAEQAEQYNLATGTWSMTPPLSTCLQAVAIQLPDQRVLVAGGQSDSILGTAQFFDPSSGTWTLAPSMGTARARHDAVQLADGRVLVAGGEIPKGTKTLRTRTTEFFDPSSGAWMPGPMREHWSIRSIRRGWISSEVSFMS
jgi:hypothetical protein